MRLVLGSCRTIRSPPPPAKSSECIKRPSLGSVTHMIQMVATTLCSLQAVSLEQLPLWDWWAERTFQGLGVGPVGSLPLPRSACSHILLMASANKCYNSKCVAWSGIFVHCENHNQCNYNTILSVIYTLGVINCGSF